MAKATLGRGKQEKAKATTSQAVMISEICQLQLSTTAG
jgi:hypothetical protein